jgi:hypothetical protein
MRKQSPFAVLILFVLLCIGAAVTYAVYKAYGEKDAL